MISRNPAGMMGVVAMLIAGAAPMARAQQQPSPTAETPPSPASTANLPLKVATVKLEQGLRASKLIGTAVYNDQNTKIGSVDDLILTDEDKVVVAIISVGGFLGIGSKLVAIPYDQLHRDNDKMLLPGATKDALNAMPGFTYGNT
jgi:sporulation protein YlmC with PRC-barrel domain